MNYEKVNGFWFRSNTTSRMFSAGEFGSFAEAHQRALEFTEAYKREHPEEVCFGYHLRASTRNKNGKIGVHRTAYLNSREQLVENWVASFSIGPKGHSCMKSFGVRKYGEDNAHEMAVELRTAWEVARKLGLGAVKAFWVRSSK